MAPQHQLSGSGAPAGAGLAMQSDLDPRIAMTTRTSPMSPTANQAAGADYLPLGYNFAMSGSSFAPFPPFPNAAAAAAMDSAPGPNADAMMADEMAAASASGMSTPMTGPGAGPLPTGFGMPVPNGGQAAGAGGGNNSSSSSNVTEFTKRRNWSQRVLEEIRDFLHILTPDGRILYVSASVEPLTGYTADALVGKFIVEYIHPDDSAIFVREFNESIATGHSMRFFYRFKKADGTFTIFESHGHPHLSSDGVAYGPHNSPGFCRGFFMMARPYPTKNAALLDSFLEHKIENERLTRRINELKREEREEEEASQRQALLQHGSGGSGGQAVSPGYSPDSPVAGQAHAPLTADQAMMPPPSKPTVSNIALTQKNLDEATASQKQDSINDKMARYEGATHIETIEMLTGLRYRDGERSQGISTGDTSPALIRGDAGIAIAADKDGRGDKKKKLKVADEYVCTDCGTLDSPEWRKGPSGPKTLCNACGLRWAKKEKKRTGSTAGVPTPPAMSHATGSHSQGLSQEG